MELAIIATVIGILMIYIGYQLRQIWLIREEYAESQRRKVLDRIMRANKKDKHGDL